MKLPQLSQADFQTEVLQASIPVLIDFSAVWCAPCKMLDPLVQQLAEEWEGLIKVYKMDADESSELVARYQVMSVPTLLLFSNGKVVERLAGYHPKDRLAAKFAPHIA